MIKLGINIILVCMTLILSTVKGYALSPCIGAYNAFTWTDCFGIDTHASGSIYRGDWLDGKYNGKGTKTYSSGEKYTGDWKNGKKHGMGVFIWITGNKYVGEFKDDKKHGHGTFTWADGKKYVGEFKDDKMTGKASVEISYIK
ncbi:MAG: cytoplasmic protein [Burkholderiales bacterium]|jgi:hypothetical protein